MRAGVGAVVALALSILTMAAASAATGTTAAAPVYTGPAFDTCSAPSSAAMQAWLASPYRGIGVYIGGVNRACPDGNLSADWAAAAVALGWNLLPLYVGPQAPCVTRGAWR